MRKKLVAMVMAATLVAGSLVGCGGGGDSASKDTSSGTTSEDSSSGGSKGSAADGIQTEVGTPRSETLIVECQNSTDTPGQFNSYMTGTAMGFGIHQMMSAHLWDCLLYTSRCV